MDARLQIARTAGTQPVVPRRRLGTVSALRLVAATWMVGYHLWVTRLLEGFALPRAVGSMLAGGSALTGMFIMLSGFMMHYAYTDVAGALRTSARELWIGRVARLWPIMLASHLLAIPFALGGKDVYGAAEAFGRGIAVTLGVQAWIPAWAFSYNGPAWTISVLLLCYAIFPYATAWLRRRGVAQLVLIVAGCWAAMLLPTTLHFARLATGFTPASDAPDSVLEAMLHAFPPFRLPDFIAGMALARLLATQRLVAARTLALVGVLAFGGVVAFLAAPLALPERFVANGLLSPLFGLVLLGAASAPESLERVLDRLRLAALGEASLSLFLLHMPLMLALAAVGRRGLLPHAAFVWAVVLFVPAMVWLSVALEGRFVKPAAQRLRAALLGTSLGPAHARVSSSGPWRNTPPPSRAVVRRSNAA
jgi:peptidoglycan/LPS O-acetylase OafA/YrhL